jgi:hypothetical protein
MIKIAGYIILGISCLLFILIPVVPWFDFSKTQIAGITAALLIAGEITFYLSLFILGKSFFEKIKSKFKFRKTKTTTPENPVRES